MNEYKLVNIVDSQLEDITDQVTLPVITGAKSNNFQSFNSQGIGGTTQLQFNIQVPSLDTAVSRHFLCESEIELKVEIAGGVSPEYWGPNQILFDYSRKNALQAFPLNSLLATIQSAINTVTVTVTTKEVMAGLLKMYNYEELARYNSLTPSLIDSFYYNYEDGIGTNNNVLANYSCGGFTKEFQPRGTFPIELLGYNPATLAYEAIPTYTVSADANGTSKYSHLIVRFTTVEPLLFLSPYISGNSNNHASFMGINNLTVTMNFGQANRSMSNASYALLADGSKVQTISGVTLNKVDKCKLLLQLKSLPASLMDKVSTKNVVNYNQYMPNSYSMGAFGNTPTKTVTMNGIQLTQIPSKILIYVKKTEQTTYDSNSFAVISKLNMNFANHSGILSSATQVQLYEMSVKNGLQMNYYEFSGKGMSNDSDGNVKLVPTLGSVLCLDPALDLGIDQQYTNMSQGQYNIQFEITVTNQDNGPTRTTDGYTIYMVTVNTGLFTTENGISKTDTGLLTQDRVLEVKSQVAVMDSNTYTDNVVGGSIENTCGIHKHMKLNFHRASEKEHNMDHGVSESASGMSASGMSASGMNNVSGITGTMKRRIHKFAQ